MTTLYVQSGAPYQSTNAADASSYLANDGSTAGKAVYFIAQALYRAEQLLNTYQLVTATIYLGKGSHFLFYCDGTEKYDTTTYSSSTNKMLQYCQYDTDSATGLGMLHRHYRTNDNLVLKFYALDCTNLVVTNDIAFTKICVDFLYDPKPTIYVNQNNYNFNITGYASFYKIQFTGVNALAINNSLSLGVYPTQFCTVSTAPTGNDGTLKVTSLGTPSTINYLCSDS